MTLQQVSGHLMKWLDSIETDEQLTLFRDIVKNYITVKFAGIDREQDILIEQCRFNEAMEIKSKELAVSEKPRSLADSYYNNMLK